jgi:exodeoxyribonuclease V beta subunit
VADPADRVARLAAWLTPFFGMRLQDLAHCAEPPPEHPLMARLLAWKALGDAHAYDQLWARILDDSGVARRLRLSAAGLRRLTNYRHLFDVLHGAATAHPTSLAELAAPCRTSNR